MLWRALLFTVDTLRYRLTVMTMGRMTRLQSIWLQLHLRLLRQVSANELVLYTLLIRGPKNPLHRM